MGFQSPPNSRASEDGGTLPGEAARPSYDGNCAWTVLCRQLFKPPVYKKDHACPQPSMLSLAPWSSVLRPLVTPQVSRSIQGHR
jgi:hypothetical protein